MSKMERAAVEFCLDYSKNGSEYKDRIYLPRVDFWRDIFPDDLQELLTGLKENESCRMAFAEGELYPGFLQKKKIVEFSVDKVCDPQTIKEEFCPGRYYPMGLASKAFDTFSENRSPFLVLENKKGIILADPSHPLAALPLHLEARIIARHRGGTQRGGAITHLGETLCNGGPGMQLALGEAGGPLPFDYPFTRENEVADPIFYAKPRLISHLDRQAREHLQAFYGEKLDNGGKILDLMASWQSHLPEKLADCRVTGLGLNQEELSQNPQLQDFLVQDLNKEPSLPFAENSFDAVICTVSFEYLLNPLPILTDLARIIRPDGQLLLAISNRWFPGMEISIWGQLHDFERQGLILGLLRRTELFTSLSSQSLRGYPRPMDDPHAGRFAESDPLFFVTARKK